MALVRARVTPGGLGQGLGRGKNQAPKPELSVLNAKIYKEAREKNRCLDAESLEYARILDYFWSIIYILNPKKI